MEQEVCVKGTAFRMFASILCCEGEAMKTNLFMIQIDESPPHFLISHFLSCLQCSALIHPSLIASHHILCVIGGVALLCSRAD